MLTENHRISPDCFVPAPPPPQYPVAISAAWVGPIVDVINKCWVRNGSEDLPSETADQQLVYDLMTGRAQRSKFRFDSIFDSW